MLHAVSKPHHSEQFACTSHLVKVSSIRKDGNQDIVQCGQGGKQVEPLEHEPDAPAERGPFELRIRAMSVPSIVI